MMSAVVGASTGVRAGDETSGDSGRMTLFAARIGEDRIVKDVRYAGNSSDPRHAVIIPDSPAYVPKHAEERAGYEDEDKPVLWLVDSSVVLGHPDYAPVVEPPGDEQREDDPDEGSEICQALVDGGHGRELGVQCSEGQGVEGRVQFGPC